MMRTMCKKCDAEALVVEPYGAYCATCWIEAHDMRPQGKYTNKNYHGEKVHTAKLTKEDVLLIDALLSDGMKQSVIADKFGVSRNAICEIANGQTWKQVTGAGL